MADEYLTAALYGMKRFNEGASKKVKELMGMEKLIELLNEYRKEKGERSLNEFEVSQPLDSLNYLKLFIKWLVENKKIKWDEKFYLEDDEGLFGTYECILMQLAIQDEPINFLISILK